MFTGIYSGLLPWLVLGVVLCLVWDGPACFSVRPQDLLAAAQAEADKYCGVTFYETKRGCAFMARLYVDGDYQHIGSFKSAKKAAEAYDAQLRSLFPDDKQKLKRYLNFPSKKEASYSETAAQARQRGLRLSGRNNRNEARAFELFREAFAVSSHAEGYEIVPLTGASRADAVFRHKGSGEDGLLIQLKASTSLGKKGRAYRFNRVAGYDGMIVVMVALDGGHLWAAAGSQLHSNYLLITVGAASSRKYAVPDIGAQLVKCFRSKRFEHMSVQQALLQCAPNNRVEARAHAQLNALFACVSMRLSQLLVHQTTVDSLLEFDGPAGLMERMRLQEKASHCSKRDGRYMCNLWRKAGAFGRRAYATEDFDMLAVSLLDAKQLQGIFLIPMSVLCSRGLVGKKPVALYIYPPWAPPKQNATREKYSWQADFFVDLRRWNGSSRLQQPLQRRLRDLVQSSFIPMFGVSRSLVMIKTLDTYRGAVIHLGSYNESQQLQKKITSSF